jgi:hypothetical protein
MDYVWLVFPPVLLAKDRMITVYRVMPRKTLPSRITHVFAGMDSLISDPKTVKVANLLLSKPVTTPAQSAMAYCKIIA